ncbi:MAG: hypothetical protein HY722_09165 [Planctomycetes bacterium]|nr:hypothetical protein [Planctomycetota bacterium]
MGEPTWRVAFPARAALQDYARACGRRYWQEGEAFLDILRIPEAPAPLSFPLSYELIDIPEWASDIGVNGTLLVPAHCIVRDLSTREETFARVDWWQASFLMVSGWDETSWELVHGPAHSYAARLKGLDVRVWDRAWVNRIFLFLRRWTARERKVDESALFGPLPAAEILVTHDIDAIRASVPLRAKTAAFRAFRSAHHFVRARFLSALDEFKLGASFVCARADFWSFDEIRFLEAGRDIKSRFFVYGGPGGWSRTPKQWLFDPQYNIATEARLLATLRDLMQDGWTVGLHPSFDAWDDPRAMLCERERLEHAIGRAVTCCRQHWLRFSWTKTWRAQREAGFQEDLSLGFNDRPGFRNGAALRVRPWSYQDGGPHEMTSVPLLFMDLQFYLYSMDPGDGCFDTMRRWIDEVKDVRGMASVTWHTHVFSGMYGWTTGFKHLLECIA